MRLRCSGMRKERLTSAFTETLLAQHALCLADTDRGVDKDEAAAKRHRHLGVWWKRARLNNAAGLALGLQNRVEIFC